MGDYAFEVEDEASRDAVWLRAFLMGATGSGKSLGALILASGLFDGELQKSLINTEKGRGKLYADRYKFAYIGMDAGGVYTPEAFCAAIDVAEEKAAGGVIVLDGVSPEWKAVLTEVDSKFGEWRAVRPKHDDWVRRLLAVEAHLIVTCRAKMKYGVEEYEDGNRTRQRVSMLGVGPMQSDDLPYEFNLIGNFDRATHEVAWSGHVEPLVDTVSNLGDPAQAEKVAADLSKWLSDGNPILPPEEATVESVDELLASLALEPQITSEMIEERFAVAKRQNRGKLHPDWVAKQLEQSQERQAALEKKRKAAEPAPASAK